MRVLFWGTPEFSVPPLRALLGFMVAGQADVPAGSPRDETDWALRGGRLEWAAAATTGSAGPRLPCSAAKVWRMLDRLKQQGFTAFIE